MAHLNTITCFGGVWTELTNADVSAIRIQNQGGDLIRVMATPDTAEPAGSQGSIALGAGDIVAASTPLADLFPSVTAGYRVWAWAVVTVDVSVSHG